MAKQNCGTCNRAGYLGSPLMAKRCNRGCTCKHGGGGYMGPNGEIISTGAMIEMVGGLPSNNWLINNGYTNIPHTYTCHPNMAQKNRDRNKKFGVFARYYPARYSNASGFLGTGISTFKIIGWGIGSLVVLAVIAKGIRVYKEAKY